MKKVKRFLGLAALFVGLLAGCGGGGGDSGSGGGGNTPKTCPAGQVLENGVCVPLTVGQSFKDCADVCPEMVVIPAGSFTMGSPATEPGRWDDEDPQHSVTFASLFAVGKYPVTVAQWEPL